MDSIERIKSMLVTRNRSVNLACATLACLLLTVGFAAMSGSPILIITGSVCFGVNLWVLVTQVTIYNDIKRLEFEYCRAHKVS